MTTLSKQLLLAVALPMMIYVFDRSGGGLPLVDAAEAASKEIVAAQIRKQGYACSKALGADPDREHPNKRGGWILRCEDATYHIHLVPRRPAHVERVN